MESLRFEFEGSRCVVSFYLLREIVVCMLCIVMVHGFIGMRDQLVLYVECFVVVGFVILMFDYRYFGGSEGELWRIVDLGK